MYVLGGKPPQASGYVTKAERFDTVENKWEEIGDMQQGRGGAFGVATQGKIFVAGGMNEEGKVSKRCEMYSVSTNEWQFIGSLNVWRVYGSMVCLKGTLYVLGGTKNNRDSLLSVECYDPTEDKWTEKTTIPVEMFAVGNNNSFTGCVVKLFKGVIDKPDFVQKVVPVTLASTSGFGSAVFASAAFSSGFVGFKQLVMFQLANDA